VLKTGRRRAADYTSAASANVAFPLKCSFAAAFMRVCACGICDYWLSGQQQL